MFHLPGLFKKKLQLNGLLDIDMRIVDTYITFEKIIRCNEMREEAARISPNMLCAPLSKGLFRAAFSMSHQKIQL
jgi:hypothetical protein